MSGIQFNPESNNCLICGSDTLRKFRAQASDARGSQFVNIVECRNCIFAWQYPLGRTERESVQMWEAAYADGGQEQHSYFNRNHQREVAKLEFEFVTRLPARDKSLLDIGAGTGSFAEVAAESDWKVTAVDPGLNVDRLRHQPNIKAIKGTMEQVPDGEAFDIVTFWDVIEHATNPIDLVARATRHLKEGGWLVIETGNYRSADRVSGGTGHWMYAYDHRWYFSPGSIRSLLARCGFSEFVFSDKVLRPNWKGSVGYAGPSLAHLLKSIAKNPLNLAAHISKYLSLTIAKEWEMSGIGIFAMAARKPTQAL